MQSAEPVERPFEQLNARLATFTQSLRISASAVRFGRDEEIYRAGESADFVYRVISGAVRVCAIDSEGGRLIEGFYMPGDLFGLESDQQHRFFAEAINECEIALVRRSVLERAASTDRDTAFALWNVIAAKLRQTNEHLIVLSMKRAADRVFAFLLDFAERADSNVIDLPMSRADIAAHLGLTIETVSRSFSRFERAGLVALDGARHVILKRTSHSPRLAS